MIEYIYSFFQQIFTECIFKRINIFSGSNMIIRKHDDSHLSYRLLLLIYIYPYHIYLALLWYILIDYEMTVSLGTWTAFMWQIYKPFLNNFIPVYTHIYKYIYKYAYTYKYIYIQIYEVIWLVLFSTSAYHLPAIYLLLEMTLQNCCW